VTKQQSMDKAGARKANKTKQNKTSKQVMDIIFLTFIVHTRQENSTISKKKKKK
jgi:hypothetical protein